MASAKRKSNVSRKKLRYEDLVSTRPGSLAGRFMRRFWHPIHRAEELRPGDAKPIEIMSERFTLYRGETGTPHVVGFRCPHRGTQLSTGWVEGDCIRCVYHGWLFDGSGQCTEQPAEEKSFASKIRIRNCPTREYLGLIFAYFGDGDAPPFPLYPHMEEEGVLEVLSTEVWPCNFFQRIDNNGDTYHVPFVHRDAYSASAANNRSGLPEISKEESPWGTTSYASFSAGWRNVFQFFMPNTYAFRNPSPEPECPWEDRMQWDVPLDDEHSLEFRLRRLPLTADACGSLPNPPCRFDRRAENFRRANGRGSALGEATFPGSRQLLQRQDLPGAFTRLCRPSWPRRSRRSHTGTSWSLRHRRHSCSAKSGKESCVPWPRGDPSRNGSYLKTLK